MSILDERKVARTIKVEITARVFDNAAYRELTARAIADGETPEQATVRWGEAFALPIREFLGGTRPENMDVELKVVSVE